MMCGIFTNHQTGIEWNALLDPHATAIAYHHAFPIHRSIGLDVTCQVTMNADEVRQRFQAPLLRPVLDFAEVWFKEVDLLTFHDPLAAVTLFDEKVCSYERGQVAVELISQPLVGMTQWTATSSGPHEVALSVDPARFFDQFFSVFEEGAG
jgi:purine nucleosidase